jgi:hypothetical protein
MDHHALADGRLVLFHAGAAGNNDATRLVAADYLAHLSSRSAIGRQVAAAHAGCLDLNDDLARSGRRVRELAQLQLALSKKDDALHDVLLSSPM